MTFPNLFLAQVELFPTQLRTSRGSQNQTARVIQFFVQIDLPDRTGLITGSPHLLRIKKPRLSPRSNVFVIQLLHVKFKLTFLIRLHQVLYN